MIVVVVSQDDWYDSEDQESWWDDAELDLPDDQAGEVVPCPHCGLEIYEEAQQCPHCGDYVTHRLGIWSQRPIWWTIIGVLGILATLLALTMGPW